MTIDYSKLTFKKFDMYTNDKCYICNGVGMNVINGEEKVCWNCSGSKKKKKEEVPAGSVIKMTGGDYMLIGDANKHLGECDCCSSNVGDIDEIANIEELINDKN